jgi:hypothetical protein
VRHERIARTSERPLTMMALCSLPLLFFAPVNQDTIWQVWLGRQVLHGARLYTDIIEVNPPLIYWLAVPQAAVCELLHLSAAAVTIGFTIILSAASLLLSPSRYRLPLLVAFTVLPLAVLGKAEHFTLVATAPYVFLIAARKADGEVRLPWIIGFLAALGFAMKPFFVVVPLALECLIWSKPRIRPETVALVVSAVAYTAAVLIFAPAYMTDVVPMLRDAYGAFHGGEPVIIFVTLAFLLAAAGAVGRKGSPTTIALLVAALAFLPAVFIQNKGWSYQSLPARGFLFLAIAAELIRTRGRPVQDAILASSALLCFYPFGPYRNEFRAETERHLAGLPRGSSVAVFATNPGIAWPMVEERGLRWTPRQMCLWQLFASMKRPELTPSLKSMVAADLRKRPDTVIVDARRSTGPAAQALLPADFREHYALALRTPRMISYRLTSARASPPTR